MIVPYADAPPERIVKLEADLRAFYANPDYRAFTATARNNQYHETCLRPLVEEILRRQEHCRILELGAGRTDIATFAATFPVGQIEVDTHDVTAVNLVHLESCSRRVWIGEVAAITGAYDLVFSTFALEHVTRPEELLKQVDRLLAPHGYHAVICPNFGWRALPIPSISHHHPLAQCLAAGRLFLYRLWYWLRGQPAFLMILDPACLHGPFRSDVDMVYLPSTQDLRAWCRQLRYRWLPLPRVRGRSLKDRLIKGWLTIYCACQKSGA